MNATAMLNAYQRQGLSISLRLVEESVERIRQILEYEGTTGVLYETRNDITMEILGEISKRIPVARAEIGKLAEKFHLEKRIGWASNEAYARLPYCWEILENVRANKMKRYGDIAEGLENELDPCLDAIIRVLREMERILLAIRKI